MRFFSLLTLISLIFLSSCGTDVTLNESNSGKTSFFIQTLELSEASWPYVVEKTARLTAGSTLSLMSQGVGVITSLPLKEGEVVKAWWAVAKLRDTVGMYGIQLKQAQTGVRGQSAALESTKLALDRAVADADTAVTQAQRTYDTLTKDIFEQRKLAQLDVFNANPENTGSTASLNIEKLRLDMTKADMDYQNIITNLDSNFHLYANDIDKTVTAILYDGDKILGITDYWKYNNDIYEPLLWSRIGNAKLDADNAWWVLYSKIADLRNSKDLLITPANVISETEKISAVYIAARNFNSTMITMLQNTLVGGWLTQPQLDGWIALYNGYKAQVNGSDAGFSAWRNQAVTGLSSTKTNLDSLKTQLSIAEKNIMTVASGAKIGYTRTLLWLQDKLRSAEIALDQAKRTRDIAKRNRDLWVNQASIGIENARIGLLQAQQNYGKLTVDAPIDGKITKVMASIGQSVNVGTPIAEIVSDKPEMTVDVEKNIADGISVWMNVRIVADGTQLTGTIIAVSRVANSNLLYTTRISVPEWSNLIGVSAKVIFTVHNQHPDTSDLTLPLSALHIVSENEWEIFLLSKSGSELIPKRKSVKLGNFRGESIEILDSIGINEIIILTDLSNFDSGKQTLTIKKKGEN